MQLLAVRFAPKGHNVRATQVLVKLKLVTYGAESKKMHGSRLTHLWCEGMCTRFVLQNFILTNPKYLLDMICYAFLSTCVQTSFTGALRAVPCPYGATTGLHKSKICVRT